MRAIYPDFIWKIPEKDKVIYLTFDDGPIPEVTEFVLEQLDLFQAKATFFCIGNNIEKNPGIFSKLVEKQHGIGNHTFNHLRGWNTEKDEYLENFSKCHELISSQSGIAAPQLFRPPYGRIKKSQAREIIKSHQIVMWDVLTGDFSRELSPETILRKSIKYTENGSIVLFHDSIKASPNMSFALPRFLEHFSEKGYQFLPLPEKL